ncbi:hypothetical protein HJFPF1_07384 [Paramyrothecium foliicola]|nr:hypothetical protein HJFPF1_07384 [Paramyrothecium foliicola]
MRFFIINALAMALFGSALAADPGVSPASVSKKAEPGTSFIIDKVVTTPKILPKPDVVLLVDVTFSMNPSISDIKKNLAIVISSVKNEQPGAQLAVVSFGDLQDPNGFKVVQGLTSDEAALQAAVDSLTAADGGDIDEDWINALYKVSTGAITFRDDSSRIIVLVGDAPSHDPSGGHTLDQAIGALDTAHARVIGVNVQNLDAYGQATKVTAATGGVIISSNAADVTKAIVSGLKNLEVIIKPDVLSCDTGLTVQFTPAQAQVSSGDTVTFHETVNVANNAPQNKELRCSVRFLLNGTPGGSTFKQSITVTVNQKSCFTCDPAPGKNKCHITTSCAPTPFGTMCLTRPGYKADGADDDNVGVQWRLRWPTPGHEHRVAVSAGTPANKLCDSRYTGPDVCKEVAVGDCNLVAAQEQPYAIDNDDQEILGGGEL